MFPIQRKMKNYYYAILTLCLAFSCSTVSFGQNNQEDTLKLHFDKLVNLSNLQLKVFLEDEKYKLTRLSFNGTTTDGHTWQFHYPDSISERISSMMLAEPKQNDSIEKIIGFVKIQNGDSIKAGSILFTQKTSEPTKLRYVETIISPNVFRYDPNTGAMSLS